jgi:hypothetical protein
MLALKHKKKGIITGSLSQLPRESLSELKKS